MLVMGEIDSDAPLLRIHSQSLTGAPRGRCYVESKFTVFVTSRVAGHLL
jgi:hypothetical protein